MNHRTLAKWGLRRVGKIVNLIGYDPKMKLCVMVPYLESYDQNTGVMKCRKSMVKLEGPGEPDTLVKAFAERNMPKGEWCTHRLGDYTKESDG